MDIIDIAIKVIQALILPAVLGIVKILADLEKLRIKVENIESQQDLETRTAHKMRDNIYDTVRRIEAQHKETAERIDKLENRVRLLETRKGA